MAARRSQLLASLRQAYPDELLYGSCKVADKTTTLPPTISFSTDNSRVEVLSKEEAGDSSEDEDEEAAPDAK